MLKLRLFVLFCVTFTASTVTAEDREVYFGMLHSHTHFSDGLGTPDEAFQMAREAGLDFFAVTEHNHSQAAGSDGVFLTPPLYQQLRMSSQNMTVDGEFVAIYGQEISTISKGNHLNIFYSDEICDMPNGNFKYLYETWLPAHAETAFAQMNHPRGEPKANNVDYGIDDYGKDFEQLISASDKYIRLIEVVKGSAHSNDAQLGHRQGQYADEYMYYLNKGFHLAPSVGGDNHKKTWGKSMHARMGVWATELTRAGIEEAIFNYHAYASEDDSIRVQFTVNDKIMGSTLGIDTPTAVTLKVQFHDPDEPAANHRVQIFYDDAIGGNRAQLIENEFFDSGTNETTFTHTAAPGSYYIAKVVQLGDHADDVWTAPVWIADSATLLAGGGSGAMPGNTDDPPMDVIEWRNAADYVGEEVTITGKIIRAHNHQDKMVFFNFDRNFRDTLSLVLFDDDFDEFDSADDIIDRLTNKNIKVKGKITLYQNERMQIILKDASQIVEVEGE